MSSEDSDQNTDPSLDLVPYRIYFVEYFQLTERPIHNHHNEVVAYDTVRSVGLFEARYIRSQVYGRHGVFLLFQMKSGKIKRVAAGRICEIVESDTANEWAQEVESENSQADT